MARELDEFKLRWNNHRIRWNRLASCPCDVPTDLYHLVGNMGMLQCTELAYMFTLFIGGDYIQDIDVNHLAYCMVHCVSQPPLFYPDEFKLLADHVLSYLNIAQDDITADSCKVVYCFCLYELSKLE